MSKKFIIYTDDKKLQNVLGGESDAAECAAEGLGEEGDDAVGEEREAGGELEAEAAEEVWARWAGGGGHGLEVGPGGLLNEAVANGDFVAGVVGGGSGGGIHGGGGGEQVFERSVGFGALEGEELQVQLEWLWARHAAVLGWEAGVAEAPELGS